MLTLYVVCLHLDAAKKAVAGQKLERKGEMGERENWREDIVLQQ